VVAVALAAAGCAAAKDKTEDTAAPAAAAPAVTPTPADDGAGPGPLTPAEQQAGWRSLFDGTSTAAWKGYKRDSVPSGWRIADGTLTKSGSTGDILTRDQFGDFDLVLEWKIAPGGNAGIFYRGTEEYDHIYWSAPEYQLLDDAQAADGKSRLTSAGAAYALYPAPDGILKPAGEWNATRILARGAHVEHWLNGQKLLEYELWSPDWEAKVKASKFGAWPGYGRAKQGYIGIQGDHDGLLALRNVKIRELK
jgi:3-keto-disaccharide hydrolase